MLRRAVGVTAMAITLLLLRVSFAWAQSTPRPTQASTPERAPSPAVKAPSKQPSANEEISADDVIRVKTTLVTSPVLVIGRNGKYTPNLRAEDFHVFEDNVEQTIAYFASVDKPFTVALLIDTSRSTLVELQDIQNAAISFVDKMRPNDRASIISFADKIEVLVDPTSDRDVLRRAIGRIRQGGATCLYDAVEFAVRRQMDLSDDRKAILLFTDGVDTASANASYESSLHAMQESDALVYPIQFNTYEQMKQMAARWHRSAPQGSGFNQMDYLRADAYLHQAAATSGTALYPARDIQDLEREVAGIVDELHNEYSLGYYPRKSGEPGDVRILEVRLNQPQLLVRARTGYVIDHSGNAIKTRVTESTAIASVISGIGSLPVARSFSGALDSAGGGWMCKAPSVPSNLALVQDGFDSNCPRSNRRNDTTNAWFVRKPGPSEIICKGFLVWEGHELSAAPLPAGYVVVAEMAAPGCAVSNDPTNHANALMIKIPAQQETVCKGYQIPRGYVVIGESAASACPSLKASRNAWVIKPKDYIETRRLWTEP